MLTPFPPLDAAGAELMSRDFAIPITGPVVFREILIAITKRAAMRISPLVA